MDSELGSVASPKSQSNVVIDGVRDMIVSGRLRPGSRLPIEKDLAEQLGVSRGSLREGVRALATLGVLEPRQGDGTYVTSLDPRVLLSPLGFLVDLQNPADSLHMLTVRRVLESEAAALAALRIDDRELAELENLLDHVETALRDGTATIDETIAADSAFHRTIASACGNPALAAIIEALVSRTLRARIWRAITESGATLTTVAEHRAILSELRAREPDRARVRMSMHILGVEEYTDAHLEDQ